VRELDRWQNYPVFDDLLQIRSPGVCFYALRDGDSVYVIDGGFIGGEKRLYAALRNHGWSDLPIRGILITHGHLDHVYNVAQLAAESNCWIFGPLLDEKHYEGRFNYRGMSRVCGWLESLCRSVFGYTRFRIDRFLADGDEIPIWGGLRAIHLPGHTDGHMGFYSAKRRLLFCGDLFASLGRFSHLPPNIFNSHPDMIPASINKSLALDLVAIAPNHCDNASYESHLFRLHALQKQKC